MIVSTFDVDVGVGEFPRGVHDAAGEIHARSYNRRRRSGWTVCRVRGRSDVVVDAACRQAHVL